MASQDSQATREDQVALVAPETPVVRVFRGPLASPVQRVVPVPQDLLVPMVLTVCPVTRQLRLDSILLGNYQKEGILKQMIQKD